MLRSASLLVLALCSATFLMIADAYASDDDRTISVTGTYTTKMAPDVVYINFTIQKEDIDAQRAKSAADKMLDDVQRVAKREGILKKYISTNYVSIHPRYSYRKGSDRRLEGYVASYHLRLTLHELEKLGTVMQRLVEAGVDRMNNVQYALKDSDAAKHAALKEAMQHAYRKATILADAANSRVGDVMTIQEGFVRYQPYNGRMMRQEMSIASASAPPPSPPAGELDVSAQVSVVYSIED